jgi:AraC family transcriptional regulator
MKETTLRFYKERLLRVLVHIQERLEEPLRLEELAALACLSPHHFHHVFTGMLGESLKAHIRRLRLERAASRLTLSRIPVVQIALEAGYQTHEAFSRAFRDSFGVSPTQFRQRHGRRLRIEVPSGVHYRSGTPVQRFRATRTREKTMRVTIKRLAPVRVAFMRHVGPYNEVGKTWEKLMMFLGKGGWLGGDTRFLGICHDDPAVTPPGKIR